MPRHPRSRRHLGPPPPRAPQPAPPPDPAAPLRSLIQEGIITAATVEARDDLSVAAVSVRRLGSLTSGVWRALSGEFATAAERLDRQAQERLDDLQRRAQALQVDPRGVLAAGMAAAHLDEHRDTLDTLVPALEADVRRLAGTDVLLGFTIEDEVLLDEDDAGEDGDVAADAEEDAGQGSPLAIHIGLFLWPAPLAPADVAIVPEPAATTGQEPDLALSVSVDVADALVDALATTCGLPPGRILPVLSALALACWSAHQIDERGEDDEGETEDVADAEAD